MRGTIFGTIRSRLLFYTLLFLFIFGSYHELWGKHLYLVTAYCGCPVCINAPKYQDGRFASGRRVYWGGAAADPGVSFGSTITLVPHWPQDWLAALALLKGRRDFVVEDRGGKIRGKHIDLFLPDSLGGHAVALEWGVRRMRIKLNGKLAP